MPARLMALAWVFFFFNDTATTEIYTLSLHDALPICGRLLRHHLREDRPTDGCLLAVSRSGPSRHPDADRGWRVLLPRWEMPLQRDGLARERRPARRRISDLPHDRPRRQPNSLRYAAPP